MRHTKWVLLLIFLLICDEVLKKSSNIVVEALSRPYSLRSLMKARIFGFQLHKESSIKGMKTFLRIQEIEKIDQKSLYYSSWCHQLCVPKGPIHKLLVKETHGCGMDGHFAINKTIYILK